MSSFNSIFRRNIKQSNSDLVSSESEPRGPPVGVPQLSHDRFDTSRYTKNDLYEKPWLEEKHPKKKWERILFFGTIGLAFLGGCAVCYKAFASVSDLDYCMVFNDTFETLDDKYWNIEVQRGGFGIGTFEWATADPKNVYTDSAGLHIVPTLTVDSTNITVAQLVNGYTLNLTTAGTCTGNTTYDCSISSNSTTGAIINPVCSAKVNTKGKMSIKYGRVEVVAKLPRGDWLWPAIWMLPRDDVYGPWPASGEIDITESRGNDGATYNGGRDSAGSTLHWGPASDVDAFWRTSSKHDLQRTDYSNAFNTFGLEWNSKYLYTYFNTRLLQVFYIRFGKQTMWERGKFGSAIVNNSVLFNPWSGGSDSTPFDQEFYLILNVAVGATNGYFPDGKSNKPWNDDSPTAPAAFWNARNQWYPTWPQDDQRGMTVRSVKMWREGLCSTKS